MQNEARSEVSGAIMSSSKQTYRARIDSMIQVCCNETMVALFKRLDPMMLKGKEHPIAPFVCIAQQGSDMWETHKQLRMIGRIKLQNSVRRPGQGQCLPVDLGITDTIRIKLQGVGHQTLCHGELT